MKNPPRPHDILPPLALAGRYLKEAASNFAQARMCLRFACIAYIEHLLLMTNAWFDRMASRH